MTDLTTQIAELRALVGRMTGDWIVEADFVGTFYINDDNDTIANDLSEHDAAGIVALRNAALPIIDAQATRIAELEAEVARIQSRAGGDA
jgi:hypothetical protein